MNKIYNTIKVAALVVATTLLGSCTEEVIKQYVNVSDSSFSLDAAGEQEFHIEVSASGDWSYEIEDEWIIDEGVDSKGLSVKAESYVGGESRYGSITFICGDATQRVSVVQSGNSATVVLNTVFSEGVPSPDGCYVAGMVATSETTVIPVTVNTQTGKVRQFTDPLPTEVDVPERQTTYEVTWVVSAVDNDGNVFLTNSVMVFGMRVDAQTGKADFIEVPDDIISGGVNDVSMDGSVWVGYGCPIDGLWVPMKWVNGVPERLPFTETNGTGVEPLFYGGAARGCSDDGSIIYGNVMDYDEAIYWDKNGDFHYVVPDMLEHYIGTYEGSTDQYITLVAGARVDAGKHRISPNGNWLGFRYVNDDTGAAQIGYIDTESGIPTMLEGYGSSDIRGITNKCELILSPASMSLEPTTIISPDGSKSSGMDWIYKNYGVIIEDSRAIVQVAANGNIFGWKQFDTVYQSWWLQL